MEHTIPHGVQATTLARYLARAWPMLPGWALRDALKKRDVRVNGARSDAQTRVTGGDRLSLYLPARYLGGALTILYDDGRILGVEKPRGLPVDVDAQGIGADTVLLRARATHPAARLCHRLDAGTGGAMLLATTDDAQRALLDAFSRHQVEKVYHAVVCGQPKPFGTLRHFLVKDDAQSLVRVYDAPRPGSLTALLTYRTLEQMGDCARVGIDLQTGRTHQVRAQMAHIGHPLVGDDKYGDRALNQRHGAALPMLWCVSLRWGDILLASTAQFEGGKAHGHSPDCDGP